ncbi:hypothetical protein GPECTOR_40g514 [Gonium pectorale]|uniref:Uncharacterized protein n=1 Tax=Gonium pectorale TaxID=33097 RepID=A0A150GBP1_GONPE|nr:hypothetical protein GPECTOR_40g514 [Gonium pectorale]|eukprot:KXZ46780.1 hypothetical protein GPECTOR_40g514 [Gonium pectorale]
MQGSDFRAEVNDHIRTLLFRVPGALLYDEAGAVLLRLLALADAMGVSVQAFLKLARDNREIDVLLWEPDSLRAQLDSLASLIGETLPAKRPRELAAALACHRPRLLVDSGAAVLRGRLEMLERYKDQSPTVSRMSQTGYDVQGTAEQLAGWLADDDERVLLLRFRAEHADTWWAQSHDAFYASPKYVPKAFARFFDEWQQEQKCLAMRKQPVRERRRPMATPAVEAAAAQ